MININKVIGCLLVALLLMTLSVLAVTYNYEKAIEISESQSEKWHTEWQTQVDINRGLQQEIIDLKAE